jgi:hypothetical protein
VAEPNPFVAAAWPLKDKSIKMFHVTIRRGFYMAAVSINARVQKHRDALRMAGLRPVQIWVPDTRRPDFAAECRRQSQIASQADLTDSDMQHFMDAALVDLDGWTE